MRLITRDDLERWAPTFYAKGDFPLLISNLVRGTSPRSTFLQFPSGSAVFISGWDGIVRSEEQTEYVPKGTSLWEFGTSEGNAAKATREYNKRTLEPLKENPLESTFIFATPTVWKDKDTWCSERIAEGKWKDVRVYDSRNVEDWLALTPVISNNFAKQIGKNYNGVFLTETFWEEWSTGPNGLMLHPSCVTAGRERQSQDLLDFLLKKPDSILAIRASSKDEAIAFIIASAKQFDKDNLEYFFSKSLITETPDDFRLARSNQTGLNIISKMEERGGILHTGPSNGHHVLVPLGPDDEYSSQDVITLPTLDKEGLIKSFTETKINRDEATKFVRESAGNITILKRLLKFEHKSNWLKDLNIRDIIPALFLGRWDESYEGDKEILQQLSGKTYEDYILTVAKLRDLEDPLFLQIGSSWRLTSPMDAWANLSPSLTKVDFDNFRPVFLRVMSLTNPALEVAPEQRYMAAMLGKKSSYSSWSREGLIQSLILIGFYGENLKIPQITSPQVWVDDLIRSLLSTVDGKVWASLNYEMPLIAEASPTSFLSTVENVIIKENSPILEMFKEESSLIHSTSRHTGLLWALEELAWMPEYLSRAALLLTKLAVMDPGGNLSNRPINSLIEIFKSWHYQTLASFDERIDVLKLISKKEKDTAWTILTRLLPTGMSGVAMNTHKTRWRTFGESYVKDYADSEIFAAHKSVIDMLISIFDLSEEKLAELIDLSVHQAPQDREKILNFVTSIYDKVIHKTNSAWHSLRGILHWQNSYTDIALPKPEISKYEKLYNDKQPKDLVERSLWLFNDHWPRFIEGYDHKKNSTEEQYETIRKKRVEALTEIYKKHGLEKVKELSETVSEAYWYGDTLAYILQKEEEIISVCEYLKDEKKNLRFIGGFIFRKANIEGLTWLFELYTKLKQKGYPNLALVKLFTSVFPSKTVWEFIAKTDDQIEHEYWLNINPNFHNLTSEEKIYGVKKLIEFKRFVSALNSILYSLEDIPTELILELLMKIVFEDSEEDFQIRGHEIGRLFEELDKRSGIDKDTMIQLEWNSLPILTSYSTSRRPKYLYNELSSNPDFFIEVLKYLYIPKDEDLLKKETEGLSEKAINDRARLAYDLLNSWKKIPGMNDEGILDETFLKNWVKKVREKAAEVKRIETVDVQIAKILSQYPENNKDFPKNIIFGIIEEINSDSIKRNFSSELFNKRGSSTRGPFDGGNIERSYAKYFSDLAKEVRNQFPVVASIFDNLSKSYLHDAKQMDERAEKDKLDY